MQTYTIQEMAHLLKCSTRTLYYDIEHLNITPTKGDRNSNLYSDRDFQLISQLREHCADKSNSRESFVPNTEVEIVEDDFQIRKLIFKDKSREAIETMTAGLSSDPFFDLEMLQRICDRGWLIPSNRLAVLFQITPKYLNTKTEYSYCGFIATKEMYAHNKALWAVRKLEIDEWNRRSELLSSR